MKSPLIIVAITALLTSLVAAQPADEQGFLRFPDVYDDQVVFTSEGDLWITTLSGGLARRLTTHDGEERYAKFSPDGKWIAYSAQYDGNQDVFVIPVSGGEPKRLTYHPYGEAVVNWTKDGRVAYRSYAYSNLTDWKVFTVSPQGDFPQSLGLDKAALISFEPNGSRVAYTRIFRNNATWKHYKGGLADQIWVADLEHEKFGKSPISSYVGHNSYPMWIGERIYLLSDSTGRKNIWSMKPDGSDQMQQTFHKDYDARWPSDGGSSIVYQLAMDLWKFDTVTGKTEKLNVQLPSERLYARTRILDPSGYIDDFDLNKDGSWLVLAARGQLFTAPTKSREAVIRRLTPDFTSRAKNPFYVDDKVFALTDASGEDEFFQFDPFLKDKPKQISRGNDIWRYAGRPSPDGKKIAFGDGNMTLWVMDAATGDLDKIATSKVWEIRDFSWSPDSRYLAYSNPENQVIQAVHIYDLKDKQDHLVTDLMYNSYFPAWDPKGKFLYFLSETNFNPFPDQYGAQFVFYKTDKLYMYLLAKDARSPFAPDSSLLMPPKKEEEKKDEDKKDDKDKKGDKDEKKDDEEKKEEKVEVKIDWDGLQARRVEIPVEPGYYYGLAAMENALYFVSADHVGMAPEGEPPKAALNLYKFDKRKSFTVSTGIDGFDISDDAKVVVVKKGSEFIRMDAGATEEPKGEGDEDPHVKLSGWSVTMDPRQEWRQMFREAWRIQRDFFYEPDMHGVDWPAVLKAYEPLIKRISTRDELNDLIGEMIGELNAGHAYVFGGDIHQPKSISVGLLGADVSRDAASGYFRIDKIYAPDLSFKKWNSPLVASGVDAKVGDYIIAIDGVPSSSVADYLMLLQDKADKDVILTLNSKAATDGAHDVLVHPISDESDLRYIEWIRHRRAYVEKASGGQIGYSHFSDMSAHGLWEYGMQYYPQCDKQGMILDVRHNGGGWVASMILAQLNRKVWTTERARRGGVGPRPFTAFYGHYAITCDNETGSDGETFTQGAKLLGLGPVFGTRTWGGWVGIRSDKPLNDKVWYTTPEFSGWGVIGEEKGHWLIEGHGVDPDYYVENDPGAVLAGKDPQLDAAIEYLLKKIKDEPPELPKEPPIPKKDVNFPK